MGDTLVDTRLGGIPRYYLAPRKDINMRVPDEVRQCVVFIGLPEARPQGQQVHAFRSTAFFVAVPSETIQGWNYIYLVTAKHVAERLENRTFYIRANTKDGRSMLVQGEGVKWFYHPTDRTVDVAVIPGLPPEPAEYKTVPTAMFLTDDIVRSANIGTGDEVFITGLFAHLQGTQRNLPIVRMGNIAMMPGEPVPTNQFGDIEAYLIEARSIGGLSGSPAFVQQTVTMGIGAFYLLGLMHGHWDIPPEHKNDEALMDADGNDTVNMGIAIVIPAKKILEVLNHPALLEQRRQGDEQRRREIMPRLDEQENVTPPKPELPKEDIAGDTTLTREAFEETLKRVSRRITPSTPDRGQSERSADRRDDD